MSFGVLLFDFIGYAALEVGYKVVEKVGENGWDTQRTESMHSSRRKSRVTALFFPLSFAEEAHDS